MASIGPLGEPRPAPTDEVSRSLSEAIDADERLLRAGDRGVLVSVLVASSLSFGVSDRWPSPFAPKADAERLEVVRRTTGGTGLLHLAGDLTWSVVLPRSDPRVGRDFARAYGRLGQGAVAFLAGVGLAGAWIPAPGLAEQYCTLSGRGQVLAVRDRIVGGAAQHATANAVLHQGTISVGIDRDAIDRIFALARPGPSERLTGLRELGVSLPSAELAARLRAALDADVGASVGSA
jgi:lipoate-protein ligase A